MTDIIDCYNRGKLKFVFIRWITIKLHLTIEPKHFSKLGFSF